MNFVGDNVGNILGVIEIEKGREIKRPREQSSASQKLSVHSESLV